MFEVSYSTRLAGPLESVFAYLSDFRHMPEWQPGLVDVRVDGPFPSSKHVVEVRRMMGRQFEARGELEDWSPPRAFALRGSGGPLRVRSRYTFSPEGTATTVEFALTVELLGPARLAEPVLRRLFQRQLEADVRRLAAVLEDRHRGLGLPQGP